MVEQQAASDSDAMTADRPGRAAETTRLILTACSGVRAGDEPRFLARRALREVEDMPSGAEARRLKRVLEVLLPASTPSGGLGGSPSRADPAAPDSIGVLLAWAGFLESRGRLPEAAAVVHATRRLDPGCPALLLHAARIARKTGETDRARQLYARVEASADVPPHLRHMARIGEALISPKPERELGRAIRRAVESADGEAAAIALEERARLRRRARRTGAALRDYGAALLRFRDPVDGGRVGHELADLLLAQGDLSAARQVLLHVESHGHPEQRASARSRLFGLSRALGDEVGQRRWGKAAPPAVVALGSPARVRRVSHRPRVPHTRRWISRLRRLAGERAL